MVRHLVYRFDMGAYHREAERGKAPPASHLRSLRKRGGFGIMQTINKSKGAKEMYIVKETE